MKLLTKAIEAKLLKTPLYSTDGKSAEDRDVLVKFFSPDSSFTWYVLEAEKVGDDWEFFGLVNSGHAMMGSELGYFCLSQLTQLRGHMGLPVERDRNFKATLAEVQA